jgi:hypothetical protein
MHHRPPLPPGGQHLPREGGQQDGPWNQRGHLHPRLGPPLNRGGGLRHLLPHTYDSIISATIRLPKPPPPSAPGSPTPTFNDTRPKGRPPQSRNRVLCLPLVDIAMAATPTIAPQATLPPPVATRRPHKDTATAAAGTPPVATASATPLPAPPTHVMTRIRTICAVAGAAPFSPPGPRHHSLFNNTPSTCGTKDTSQSVLRTDASIHH